ncbi:hypothetical protein BDZ89DRAFT_950399 [Hymenopellis radicata]|nr:hypothetical protein BDZ89DRAFT_950399 [Hymenopellis radicata]
MAQSTGSSSYTVNIPLNELTLEELDKPLCHYSQFTDACNARERAIFLRIFFIGCLAISVVAFGVFGIYWGALWKIPDHQLDGCVLDFDHGDVGRAITEGLISSSSSGPIKWRLKTGLQEDEVGHMVLQERTWVAVAVNANASLNLENAGIGYDSTSAVTFYGVEARSENAYRSLLRPTAERALSSISQSFAEKRLANMTLSQISFLASNAPQVITNPISHTAVNLAAFDIPVASAITFIGMVYLLILSFFIVSLGVAAREASGLEKRLTTASLVRVRFASLFVSYFVISLFYSLLSKAFQVDFSRKFGHSGFLVFWMINFVGILSVGLALEAMSTLLTPRFLPFFMILWIIVNVSVCFMPIELMPHFYRYGYAIPFYNMSRAVRTVLFSTKNEVGLHFGILIAWAAVSAITLPTFQWYRRRGMSKLN